MNNNLDISIIETLELINFTLSNKFIEKWRHKYSIKFVKHFQLRMLDSFRKSKPVKISSLYTYLSKKCKYSPLQTINFFKSIDIDIYYPIIQGRLTDLKKDYPETIDLL